MKLKITFLLALLIINIQFCNYKAGNLISLSYPVKTELRAQVISDYIDTLILKYGYNVPEKWNHFNKLTDLDSINNKRVYFKSKPEEMYLISLNGMVILQDVFNPSLNPYDWVAIRDSMPKFEEIRVKRRFDQMLSDIESLAKKDKLPDSVIYK